MAEAGSCAGESVRHVSRLKSTRASFSAVTTEGARSAMRWIVFRNAGRSAQLLGENWSNTTEGSSKSSAGSLPSGVLKIGNPSGGSYVSEKAFTLKAPRMRSSSSLQTFRWCHRSTPVSGWCSPPPSRTKRTSRVWPKLRGGEGKQMKGGGGGERDIA